METTIADNIARVRDRIEKASGGRRVFLVGVAKTKPPALIRQAVEAGLDAVGENYVQEFRDKSTRDAYGRCPVHIIGHLQLNKVKYVAGRTALIQSVDSPALLAAISRRAQALDAVQDVLLELNLGGEATKTGASAQELEALLAAAHSCPGARVRGLMTIPPIGGSAACFENIYNIYIDIKSKKYDNVSMDFLSMGMSEDYEDAVRAGANMVRVGSAIFGPRDYGVRSL